VFPVYLVSVRFAVGNLGATLNMVYGGGVLEKIQAEVLPGINDQ